MTDINNKKDFKEINVVDNNLSINAVNNSILIDDKKTLNLVKQVVAQRGVNSRVRYDIPESFDILVKKIIDDNESDIIQSCQEYLKQCESGNKHFMTPDIDGIINMLNINKDTN